MAGRPKTKMRELAACKEAADEIGSRVLALAPSNEHLEKARGDPIAEAWISYIHSAAWLYNSADEVHALMEQHFKDRRRQRMSTDEIAGETAEAADPT